ncbi:MAG: tRNA(adenine34) deaminase [Cyclobacteriaceae bacterium]|jgi:tRNA(adenine34) deaminase
MEKLSVYSDEHFMRLALNEAQRAFEEGEIPVGAVVVCQNKVIAKAYNQVQKLNDVTAHAEILAITAAQNYLGSKYLDECAIYVTLEPCVMCGGALYWSQIRNIYYAARDEKRGYTSVSSEIVHPKTEVKYGILANEAEDLIKSFFHKIRGNKS